MFRCTMHPSLSKCHAKENNLNSEDDGIGVQSETVRMNHADNISIDWACCYYITYKEVKGLPVPVG